MAAYPARFAIHRGALLAAYVLRQSGGHPGPVLDWVMRRANRYFEAFPRWSIQDHDLAAALDLVLWQRGDQIKSTSRWGAAREVVEFLEGLEEVANNVKETEPCHLS